ncbi:CsiV family protein [Aliiglaciecola sp. SL4]|uniref:CsiV family protein n=1 Tax=Aliiglaciecola sp. SL4 TaxID=3239806 RepID=UPI00355BAB0B
MKGKLTVFCVQKCFRLSLAVIPKAILAWLLLSISFVAASQEKQWWFDVEVIVYKRNIDPASIVEKFPNKIAIEPSPVGFENLHDYLYPDLESVFVGLPLCFSESTEPQEIGSDIILKDTFGNYVAFDDKQFALANSDVIENDDVAEPIAYLDIWQLNFPLEEVKVPTNFLCRMEHEKPIKPFIEKVPTVISHTEDPSLHTTQLLSSDSFELNELARDINRQRGLSTILHMGWRQQTVFGQDNAIALHLFAGKNYGKEFDAVTGKRIPEQSSSIELTSLVDSLSENQNGKISASEFTDKQQVQQEQQTDLIEQIKLALNDDNFEYSLPAIDVVDENHMLTSDTSLQENDIWELDGTVKVFLRYIQRTPYLHIDSDLDFRAPVFDSPAYLREEAAANQVQQSLPEPDRLQSYPFKQLRRVISNQVHYFDHPLFGMIIQIRRYDLPATFDGQKN